MTYIHITDGGAKIATREQLKSWLMGYAEAFFIKLNELAEQPGMTDQKIHDEIEEMLRDLPKIFKQSTIN